MYCTVHAQPSFHLTLHLGKINIFLVIFFVIGPLTFLLRSFYKTQPATLLINIDVEPTRSASQIALYVIFECIANPEIILNPNLISLYFIKAALKGGYNPSLILLYYYHYLVIKLALLELLVLLSFTMADHGLSCADNYMNICCTSKINTFSSRATGNKWRFL